MGQLLEENSLLLLITYVVDNIALRATLFSTFCVGPYITHMILMCMLFDYLLMKTFGGLKKDRLF